MDIEWSIIESPFMKQMAKRSLNRATNSLFVSFDSPWIFGSVAENLVTQRETRKYRAFP